MPSTTDRHETLRSFQLSEYAARAYLALLELGETEARDVSRMGKIPLAKVYSVLEGLQAKGLCEIFPGTPKRYAPVPIQNYVARVVSEHKRASDALESKLDDLVDLFPIRAGGRLSDRGRIQAFSGRRSAIEHETKLLASAEGELILLCSVGRLERLRHAVAELKDAHARGVKIRMMIPRTSHWSKDVALFSPYAKVRERAYSEAPRSRGVSFMTNHGWGLVIDHIPDDASVRDGNDVGLHVGTEGIVAAFRDLLGHAWEGAPAPEKQRRPLPTKR